MDGAGALEDLLQRRVEGAVAQHRQRPAQGQPAAAQDQQGHGDHHAQRDQRLPVAHDGDQVEGAQRELGHVIDHRDDEGLVELAERRLGVELLRDRGEEHRAADQAGETRREAQQQGDGRERLGRRGGRAAQGQQAAGDQSRGEHHQQQERGVDRQRVGAGEAHGLENGRIGHGADHPSIQTYRCIERRYSHSKRSTATDTSLRS